MQEKLTNEEQKILLHLAREAMERGVRGEALAPLDVSSLPPSLREEGSSFITLTERGQLRGCIGDSVCGEFSDDGHFAYLGRKGKLWHVVEDIGVSPFLENDARSE